MVSFIWEVITLVFVGIMCFALGLYRGWKCYEHEYDRGYNDAMNDFDKEYVYVDRDEMLNHIWKEQKGRQLLNEMEELFEDDNGIDCGCY